MLTDSSPAGSGTFAVADMNGSSAAQDLGLNVAASGGTIEGDPIAFGSVTLTGGAGDDTLIGGRGTDFLSGGSGNNVLSASGGTATVVESGDWNFTLTNNTLTMASDGGSAPASSDLLSGITNAELTGGAHTTLLNASAFSLGNVTLTTTGGLATLEGGTGSENVSGAENVYNLDVANLAAPDSATDANQQFSLDDAGSSNTVKIMNAPTSITQDDFYWAHIVSQPGQPTPNYDVDSFSPLLFTTASSNSNTINVTGNIIVPGMNITLEAEYVNIDGNILNTSAAVPGGINITARNITIDDGAQLLANSTDPNGAGGSIVIDAEDPSRKITQVPLLGNVQVNLNKTTVTVDGA